MSALKIKGKRKKSKKEKKSKKPSFFKRLFQEIPVSIEIGAIFGICFMITGFLYTIYHDNKIEERAYLAEQKKLKSHFLDTVDGLLYATSDLNIFLSKV